jgi:hypothetical protein
MNESDNSPLGPQETDLLVKFEIDHIPTDYRVYYATKRNNLFASIQGFHEMWEYYLRLDRIWMREFTNLKTASEANRMFPLLLYFNAHAKIRVSIELAFTGCMSEARSILRDAIEFVAHAHVMMDDAELQKTWLNKNDGKFALEAFKDAYERHKREGVFKGLAELHKSWGELSETGSHANLNAIVDRFVQVRTDQHIEFRLNYTGLDPKMWALLLFTMLLTCSTMEHTLFADYDARLRLDVELRRMREDFERYKEWLRELLKTRYRIEPPGGILIPRPTILRP